MKKYVKPELKINVFSIENIVTASAYNGIFDAAAGEEGSGVTTSDAVSVMSFK